MLSSGHRWFNRVRICWRTLAKKGNSSDTGSDGRILSWHAVAVEKLAVGKFIRLLESLSDRVCCGE